MTPEQRVKANARNTAWRKRNPEKTRAYCRNYYAANAEKRIALSKKWREENPEQMLRSWRRKGWRKAGIDPVAAEAALTAHSGSCACCGTDKPGGKGWCVDHDHATGRVRGILCFNCNFAIGKLGDTLEGVLRAVRYLTGPQKEISQ